MDIIVVLDLTRVALVYPAQEFHELFVAELRVLVQAHHSQDRNCNGAQTLLAPNFFGKTPNVEVLLIEALEVLLVRLKRLVDCFNRGRRTT